VQMKVKFWSTSFAAPKPLNMNQVMELKCNYPPLPSITQKKRFTYFLLCPATATVSCVFLPAPPVPPPGMPPLRRIHPPHRQGRLPNTGAHIPTPVSVSLPRKPSNFSTGSHLHMGHLRAGGAPPESVPSLEPSIPFVRLHHATCQHVSIPNPRSPPSLLCAVIKLCRASSSDLPRAMSVSPCGHAPSSPTHASRPCYPSHRRRRIPHHCAPSAHRFPRLRLPPEVPFSPMITPPRRPLPLASHAAPGPSLRRRVLSFKPPGCRWIFCSGEALLLRN
jgi:hypothetical protein